MTDTASRSLGTGRPDRPVSFFSASFQATSSTITLRGELDTHTAALLDVFTPSLRERSAPVTVSLRHLSAIDPTGVAALTRLCARLCSGGTTPRVVDALPAVARACRGAGAGQLLVPPEQPARSRRYDQIVRARSVRSAPGWRMALAAWRADLAMRRIERAQAIAAATIPA